MTTPKRMALIPKDDYEALLRRSVCAPKILPQLSGKQKRKVNDQLDNTFFVDMHVEERTQMPIAVGTSSQAPQQDNH